MTRQPLHLVGLISDTHGLVRPDVHTALTGVELILHAGDVGGDEILDELQLIAPVRAVHGNTDPVDDARLAASIEMTERSRVPAKTWPSATTGAPSAGAMSDTRHMRVCVARSSAWIPEFAPVPSE